VGDATHPLVIVNVTEIDILEARTRIATAGLPFIVISVRKGRLGKPSYAKKAAQQLNGLAIASGSGSQNEHGNGSVAVEAKLANWSSDRHVARAEIRIVLAATTAVARDATVVTSAALPDLLQDIESVSGSGSVTVISAALVRVCVAIVVAAH
jgi:hypothetical protein